MITTFSAPVLRVETTAAEVFVLCFLLPSNTSFLEYSLMDGFMRIVFVVDAASESVSPGTVQQIMKSILRGARQSQSLPVKYGFASSLLGPL